MSAPQSLPATAKLKVGDLAPDFTLNDTQNIPVALSAFRGQKNVVLAFFPFAYSATCSAQLPSYEAELERFQSFDTQVIGISMDARYSLANWAKELGLSFPVVSDFYPQGVVTDAYGARHPAGMPERALFVIDKEGKIAWIHVHRPTGEQPDNEELFDVLRKISAR